ncbi:Mov34/MPN/PAD-1 family protein [Shewanella psychromarinicola]|uniref:JAB domain-containing protein n=1 Tax=Shewanella psychromarinicola TaxID=2487742 RepID=A0A3N4DAD1_9GAMM|nr:Mov34/MPN/PAD-1 family protein [Shewanella psychromarinicola]AZG34008.1 hypothetical protein EGC80_03045 [Shewanella psychromarinicola]MCL1084417.1 Mov34/MPN/PAD-1 family protein [Shewanella psychromarinicola]RPA22586.1 hypothetical protein EGC77_21390 [Shewanella psychromarinicola]
MKEYLLEVKEFGSIRIPNNIIERISTFRQLDSMDSESGGVLLGSHLNSIGRLKITDFTTPLKNDRQTRNSFFRSNQHNIEVQKVWKESCRRVTFLGLWHTHAEDIPTPSSVDIDDWKVTLRTSLYDGEGLVFLIIGNKSAKFWFGFKKSRQIDYIGEVSFE